MSRRSPLAAVPAVLLGVAALGAMLALPAAAAEPEVRHPEDLFIVDCLLPAKVRSLGRHTKFAAPRRVARLSAHECGLRGGEHAQDTSDNAWALQAWIAQAEGGDADAMNNVGEIYEQGVRGPANHAEAAKWYRRAAEAGSHRAQTNLGALYEQGLGVEKDPGEALAWYRKAAGMTSPVDLDAQREIEGLKGELAKSRAEAEATRAELARVTGDLDGARAELAAAEGRAREAEVKLARAREEAARAATPAPEPAPEAVAAVREVEERRRRVAELEAAQGRYRRLLAELEASSRSGEQLTTLAAADLAGRPGPTIQFVRPDVLATRGPAVAPLPGGAPARAEVVGRVAAPLGPATLLADGREVEIDRDGYFRVQVDAQPGTIVRFVAVDRASRKASAELQFVAAATPAAASAAPAATTPRPAGAARRSFALVVANGSYRELPGLKTARSDGEAVARVLRDRFGYRTTLVADATFLDTVKALHEIGKGLGPDDDLLVYYAGHGRMTESGQRGYWLPVDARAEDASTWIPNEAVAKILGSFSAGRILVVSDSCYAGAFASTGLDLAATPRAGGTRSRMVFTSGGLQPVLDEGGDGVHSIFARALLSVLQLAERPMTASEVFAAVAARVAWKTGQMGLAQTPQLAPIRYAGHEAGELVLAPSRG